VFQSFNAKIKNYRLAKLPDYSPQLLRLTHKKLYESNKEVAFLREPLGSIVAFLTSKKYN